MIVGRYAGGKGRCYQRIINLMPAHRVYIEAYLGGGSVMLHKRPAVMNIGIDLDADVIKAWSAHLAKRDDATASSPNLAMRAGIVRNSDAAPSPTLTMPARTVISDEPSWHLIEGDALAVLPSLDLTADTLIYADPPYLLETRRQMRLLYNFEYNRADHVEMLTLFRGLDCMVMISGYESKLYDEMLGDWHRETFTAYDRGNNQRQECVWMNFAPPVELHDYSFLGDGFRERERIKRKKQRWIAKLKKMPKLERQALLAAIREAF